MNEEVTCPYCGEDFEINHDDGAHYRDGEEEQDYCPNCDKTILIYSSCSWWHEARKADCLNGAPHPWSEWRTLWANEDTAKKEHPGQVLQRRYCTVCDKEESEWRTPEIMEEV